MKGEVEVEEGDEQKEARFFFQDRFQSSSFLIRFLPLKSNTDSGSFASEAHYIPF